MLLVPSIQVPDRGVLRAAELSCLHQEHLAAIRALLLNLSFMFWSSNVPDLTREHHSHRAEAKDTAGCGTAPAELQLTRLCCVVSCPREPPAGGKDFVCASSNF